MKPGLLSSSYPEANARLIGEAQSFIDRIAEKLRQLIDRNPARTRSSLFQLCTRQRIPIISPYRSALFGIYDERHGHQRQVHSQPMWVCWEQKHWIPREASGGDIHGVADLGL